MSFIKELFKTKLNNNEKKLKPLGELQPPIISTKIDYLVAQKVLLFIIGLWFEQDYKITSKSTIFKYVIKIVKRIYQVFITLSMLHIAVAFSVSFYFGLKNGNFSAITYSVSQAIIYYFSGFMIFYLQVRETACYQLIQYVNQNFKFRSAKGLTFATADVTYYFMKKFTIIYAICAESSVLSLVILPFFRKERTLPLPCWYPFDYTLSPWYEFLFFIQTISQIQLAMGFLNSLTLTLSVSMMICNQFDLLFCSLKNLKYTAMIFNGKFIKELKIFHSKIDLTKDKYRSDYFIAVERLETLDDVKKYSLELNTVIRKNYDINEINYLKLGDEMHEALCDCIRHHQMIVKCCHMLEDLASPYILVKSIEIAFQICILALSYLKTDNGSIMDSVILLQYLMMTLFDLYMISYLGQIIQNQSVRVRDFLYDTKWYLYGKPFRSTMQLILLHTLQSQIVTGGKFFILGYDKFTAILKLSFSYFTLLNKFGTKE